MLGWRHRSPGVSGRQSIRTKPQSCFIMRSNRFSPIGFSSIGLLLFFGLSSGDRAAGQNTDPLRVKTELRPGPYLVGQGFELRVGVTTAGQRPKIDPPRLKGARTWAIGTEVRPITTSSIGSVVARESLFVVRFRVVSERAGTLEIPSILAQIKGRSGRSQPKSVSIKTAPVPGRPAEFLGGIGRFEVHAEASPKVVRIGQELDFRIKITGEAAWGMTDRPDLRRFERLGLGLRIEPKPDETIDEPPVRTFVYRLRPARAGEAVLPPVAIAAFDPSLSRYVTHVTAGVPIRVVAVASFDPSTINDEPPSTAMSRPALILWTIIAMGALSFAVFLLLRQLRRRLDRPRAFGPDLARRFAKQTARYLGTLSVECDAESLDFSRCPPRGRPGEGGAPFEPASALGLHGGSPSRHVSAAAVRRICSRDCVELLNFDGPEFDGNLFLPSQWYASSKPMVLRAVSPEIVQSAARRIYERLSSYLLIGTSQSLGVLTPEEARAGVASLTSSAELGAQAGELTAWCDVILYGESSGEPPAELRGLLDQARRLFEALGRVKSSRERGGG